MTALSHLTHDHADINRRVLLLGESFRSGGSTASLVDELVELREVLFLHFAREEEGLFPFLGAAVPELDEQVQALATAHDTICGALARMVHLAETTAPQDMLGAMFERFEIAYGQHAVKETRLLESLELRLDAGQREQLAALVEGL